MTEEESDKMFSLEMQVQRLKAELASVRQSYEWARSDLAKSRERVRDLEKIVHPPRESHDMEIF